MKIIVNPHKLEIVKTPVNEKEINITRCEFEFAEEITNEYVKEAYFTYNGESYKQIIVNNECDIPYEVLNKKGQVELGVVAYLVENEQEIKRYNPSPAYFETWLGSLREAENSEPITPSEMEQYEQALQDGLTEVNEKLDDIDQALEDVNTAIEETNNLDLDVSKDGKIATVTLTKKDASTKVVTLSDGTSLMFNWQGTSLGIKTDEDADYTYVDLQGIQGETGPMGAPFTIKKTYSSVAEMNADFNNMEVGDYVMITSTVETEDNAKLYCKGIEQWIFITDFSGATGIQGPTGATPNISIGTVTSGDTPNVTRTGTNENPILNFTLVKGDKGDTGNTGPTGNGISTITKTSTSGYVDTYTITYTNGTTSTFEVTNGEVSQAELDKVQRQVDYDETAINTLPTTSYTGTDITLNGTADAPLDIVLSPSALEQDTTTGKNLFDGIMELGIINGSTGNNTSNSDNIRCKNYIPVEELTDYRITSPDLTGSILVYEYKEDFTYNLSSNKAISQSETLTTNAETKYIRFRPNTSTTDTSTRYMVEKGTTATEYEPYTGGIASPNPDYPQDIRTITGDNTLVAENENLFDINWLSGTNITIENGVATGTANSFYNAFKNGLPYTNFGNKQITITASAYTDGNSSTENNGGLKIIVKYIEGSSDEMTFRNNETTKVTKTLISDVSKNIKNIIISYGNSGSNIWHLSDIMINYGNTALSYKEHKGQVLPLNLPMENLFDKANATWISKTISNSTRWGYKLPKTNKNYYVLRQYKDNQQYNIYEDVNGELTNRGIVQTYPTLITNSNNDFYLLCLGTTNQSNAQSYFNANNFMMSYKYASSYTPYGTTPIEYCKIGNYSDEFIKATNETGLTSGKWYLKKNIYKVVFNGSESWSKYVGTNIIQYYTYLSNAYHNVEEYSVKSNYFNSGIISNRESIFNTVYTFNGGIAFNPTQFEEVSDWKEWLNTHNVTTYYTLSTPVYILLNDTLQEQLEDIRYALGYDNQTNIIQINDNLPFIISTTGLKPVPTKTSELTNDAGFITDSALTNVAYKNADNNFTTGQTINGDLQVYGDITNTGSSYETHAEKVYTRDDYIITRDGAISGLGTGDYTGFEAKKYDGTNDGRLVFDNTGTARVGDVGDEVPLLARDESSNMTNNYLMAWDSTNLVAKTVCGIAFVTQAEYDALISSGTYDSNTLYMII